MKMSSAPPSPSQSHHGTVAYAVEIHGHSCATACTSSTAEPSTIYNGGDPSGEVTLTTAKRKLKRLEHRIDKVKRLVKKADGAHRKALARKLHKLQAHKRKAAKRRKVAARKVAGVCA